MKRNIVIVIILVLLTLSSCVDQLLPPDISSNTEQAAETGGINIKIFIPDYQKLAEQNNNRVIAPQTAKIRFSVAKGADNYVQHGELIQLNLSSLTPVQGAPSSLPGGTWNGTFLSLESKTYTAGSLKIELLDQNNRVITQGVNQADVAVSKNQTAQAMFFTTPEIKSSILGSLSNGEMRFWRVTMMGGYSYNLTVNAEGSYPDVVVFNDNGTFKEYYSVSSGANSVINFNPAAENNCYLGVWASRGAVSSYSVAMSYKFNNLPQDFSGNNFNGWQASAQGNNAPMPVIVVDNGKSILEFASRSMYSGGRAVLSRTVNYTVPTMISFNVKTDIGGSKDNVNTFFKFYIDGVEKASYSGLNAGWKAGSIIIPAGTHEIKWVLEKDSGSFYQDPITNKVWLADISFSPDVTEYLDMLPKGPKNTFVGGFPIQYTARALRSDGSVRSGISGIVYSGTGVNSATGLFTPTAPGTYTITASKDGKTVKSDIITVHPADYLRRPYTNTITGKTYNGYQGVPGTLNLSSGYLTFTLPAERNINADGFVTFEGESKFTGRIYAIIDKEGDSSLRTTYEIQPGKFTLRVWLRFGEGRYSVYFNTLSTVLFTVTNTCTDRGADGDPRFLYPSSVIQSDDFRITNLLSDILYGVNKEADKIKKINDYLVQNTVYDRDSVNNVRKPQDALSILGTRYHVDSQYEPIGHYLAVCDGYSNAAAALLRAAGIETKIITSNSMNHAWNNVYTGGSWKFLDVTWNDPIPNGSYTDNGPLYVRYTYYLLPAMDGVDGDHFDGSTDNSRSINPVPVLPKMKGMPDGWY
jgi:transglutaminase-like putative cysteine protease